MLRYGCRQSAFGLKHSHFCIKVLQIHRYHSQDGHVTVEQRPATRRRKDGKSTINVVTDYHSYIDPSDLRQSLENVRAVNRASLIRKIDQHGKWHPTPLPAPTLSPPVYAQAPADAKINRGGFVASRSLDLRSVKKDTAGIAQPLLRQWRVSDSIPFRRTFPWTAHVSEASHQLAAPERLVAEIEAFDSYITPSDDERQVVIQVMNDVDAALALATENSALEIIGSRSSGLAMPLSDIDLNIVPTEGRSDDVFGRETSLANLRKIHKSMRKCSRAFRFVEFVNRAKIPIVRAVHRATGLDVQVQQTISAYNSTKYVAVYMRQYPTLRSLFILLRHLLIMRGLSDGSQNGLSSYPLLNMILASLKLDEEKAGTEDVGGQLLSFLKLFSELDFDVVGLSVVPAKMLPKLRPADDRNSRHLQITSDTDWALHNEGFPYAMYLRDPADPSNDLGKSCALIKHIQATFLAARTSIIEGMSEWTRGADEGKNISILEYWGGDYTIYQLERASLSKAVAEGRKKLDTNDAEL